MALIYILVNPKSPNPFNFFSKLIKFRIFLLTITVSLILITQEHFLNQNFCNFLSN